MGLLLNGLLAELPAILDSTTSDYIGVVGRGGGEPWQWQGKHMSSIHTSKWAYLCCR